MGLLEFGFLLEPGRSKRTGDWLVLIKSKLTTLHTDGVDTSTTALQEGRQAGWEILSRWSKSQWKRPA